MPLSGIALYLPFVIITLALTLYFMILQRLHPSKESKLVSYMPQKPKKPKVRKSWLRSRKTKKQSTLKPEKKIEPSVKPESEEKSCPHYVGYLTTLPKGSTFPDECFGCRSVIQCLRIEPTKVIESFYVAASEAETH